MKCQRESIGAVMEMLGTHHLQIATDNNSHASEETVHRCDLFTNAFILPLKVKWMTSHKSNLLVVITFPLTFC